MNAGPGKTSKAMPISKIVAPITETITRLAILIFSVFQILENHFIQNGESIGRSLAERVLMVITSSATTRVDRWLAGNRLPFDRVAQAVEEGHLRRFNFASGNFFRKEARLIHFRKFLASARTWRPFHFE